MARSIRIKSLILALILLLPAFVPVAAYAVQDLPPYPAAFWVNGTLAPGQAPEVSNYKVVFYYNQGNPANGFAFVLTDNSGKFRINGLDDLRMLPLQAGTKYYIGVVNRNGFGVNEKEISLTEADLASGYFNFDLELKKDEGIPDPDAGNGYIHSIYIYPEGGHVKIKWAYRDASVTGAVIYRLASDTFSKDNTLWEAVAAGDKNSPDNNIDLGVDDGKTTYYMVMPKINAVAVAKDQMFNLAPAVAGDYLGKDPIAGIPYTAWPVVKFEVAFAANETKLIGLPFYPTGPTGFITRLSEITAQSGFTDGSIWVNKNKTLQRWDCVKGVWSFDDDILLASGGWLLSKPAKTYPFTGALIRAAFTKSLIVGSDLYSYAFPVSIDQATPFVSGGFTKGDSLWLNRARILQRLDYDAQWSGNFVLGAGDGFWYQNKANEAANKQLKVIP